MGCATPVVEPGPTTAMASTIHHALSTLSVAGLSIGARFCVESGLIR